jgi:hypothetical protein
MSKKKSIAWNRKLHQDRTIDLVQSAVVPNGYHTAYTLKSPIDSFKTHITKCMAWWNIVKNSYPGTPHQKDKILNSMVGALAEIWPMEIKEYGRKLG